MTGVSKHTILNLLEDLGCVCAEYHNRVVRNVKAKRVEVDEIWQFCYSKDENVPKDKIGVFGYGDVWTTTGIDADTKLIISYLGRTARCQSSQELRPRWKRILQNYLWAIKKLCILMAPKNATSSAKLQEKAMLLKALGEMVTAKLSLSAVVNLRVAAQCNLFAKKGESLINYGYAKPLSTVSAALRDSRI